MSSENENKAGWGFSDFGIHELWMLSKGEGITVALLDSGLHLQMGDFKNKSNIIYFNALTGSEKKEDCIDDLTGHGTDCAGILCADGNTIFGVAPGINLLVVKITNETGERIPAAIIKGLEKAISMNVDIISVSFTYPATIAESGIIYEKIKMAYQKDITIVASAGDSGSVKFPVDNYPASFPECLSIGGIDRMRKRSLTSTKSSFLDLMGPGEELKSIANPGTMISGTSFSTPFVAGVIALLKSIAKKNGKLLSNIELYDILKRTADIKVGGKYSMTDYGWGIINPVAAMNMLGFK
jgi:subtilisin family serine protease